MDPQFYVVLTMQSWRRGRPLATRVQRGWGPMRGMFGSRDFGELEHQ